MSAVHYRIKKLLEVTLEIGIDDDESREEDYELWEEPYAWAGLITATLKEDDTLHGVIYSLDAHTVPHTTEINVMKRYFGLVTTQYDSMEWGQDFLVSARDQASAEKKANAQDWTHGDGIEGQEEASLREIPEEHYQVFKEYIIEI